MTAPLAFVFPVIPAVAFDVQLKVEPFTFDDKFKFTVPLEQTTFPGVKVKVATGIGFTTMVYVAKVP